MRELVPFIRHFAKDPMAVQALDYKPIIRYRKTVKCFEMLRAFPTMDKLSIKSEGFKELSHIKVYDDLHVERSFEYVRDFKCSSNP